MENAQRAMDAVNQRFTQTSLEGQANQTEVAVLNPAVAPLEASSPKIMLNVLLSVFLGGMLGVGFGLLAEMIDRRVRSCEDIIEAFDIPVFAVIRNKPAKPRRFSFPALPKFLQPSV
jgi:capsular polysaccharide biosynthesis protein